MSSGACSRGFERMRLPSLGRSPGEITGITAIAAANAWAVGQRRGSGVGLKTLILHWNGASWNLIPSPSPGSTDRGGSWLNAVSGVSAQDVWAGGLYTSRDGKGRPLIEHWNGSSWRVVPSPSVGQASEIQSITAVSRSDVWAIGTAVGRHGEKGLVFHWDGRRWSRTPELSSPMFGSGASGARDVWAVGIATTEHWDGSSWQAVPVATGDSLDAVVVRNAGHAFAVGFSQGASEPTVVDKWNGSSWVTRATGPSGDLNAIAFDGPEMWAVGSTGHLSASGFHLETLVMHFSGSVWRRVASPTPGRSSVFASIATKPNAGLTLMAGYVRPRSGSRRPLVERAC